MIQNERASWLHFLNVTKEVQTHETVLVCVCCDTHVKRGNYRYVNTICFADLLHITHSGGVGGGAQVNPGPT